MTVLREQRRLFWEVLRGGAGVEEAALAAGFSKTSGSAFFRQAGGVAPQVDAVGPGPRRLTIDEREAILAGVVAGEAVRAIAARIGRSPSTVSRELARNVRQKYDRSPRSPGRPRTRRWDYSPHRAQLRADRNAGRPKTAKLAANDRLRDQVQDRLGLKHSPEQIARRLRVEFPGEPEMWVSHETIYQSLYVQGRGALRRELTAALRTGRALRKPHRRPAERRGRIPAMVHISQRPPEVADRAVPGHWEGDLIVGAHSKSAIGTLVERTTGFTLLLHLPTNHGAEQVQAEMIAVIRSLDRNLIKTVTWDQGAEMAGHRAITVATDVQIYFCDPSSPWQRATNENTNGLLRQYFPKGTDLSGYHRDYLNFVADQLNDRPRKRLDWRSPKEALRALLSEPPQPPGVALTG